MGGERPRKREKNFSPEFCSYPTWARKFQKNSKNSVHTQSGQENSEKNSQKSQKLKNLIPALFLAKTGWYKPRQREKNFSPKFLSYSTRARKFQKKYQKI